MLAHRKYRTHTAAVCRKSSLLTWEHKAAPQLSEVQLIKPSTKSLFISLIFVAVSFFTLFVAVSSQRAELTRDYGRRRLQNSASRGYASGTSAIFWMNGNSQGDYPFSCRCDAGDLAAYNSGQNLTVEAESDWYNPFDSENNAELSSGVSCAGSFSTSVVFESDPPYCDAKNAAMKYDVNFVYWLVALSSLVIMQYL